MSSQAPAKFKDIDRESWRDCLSHYLDLGDGYQDGRRTQRRRRDSLHVRFVDEAACIGRPFARSYLNIPRSSAPRRNLQLTLFIPATGSGRIAVFR